MQTSLLVRSLIRCTVSTLFVLLVVSTFSLQAAPGQTSGGLGTARRPTGSGCKPPHLEGRWRGSFSVKDSAEIPFLFEITGNAGTGPALYFINAEERFYGGKVSVKEDSVFVALDQFDNEMALTLKGNMLTGVLRKQDKTGTALSMTAEKGNLPRFKSATLAPVANISGTYDIIFSSEAGKQEKAVGLFTQDGNKLRATFLRISGDSRYLDGIISGNQFYLSTFIGSGPGYYSGTINSDGSIKGSSGVVKGGTAFSGSPNEDATLPDAFGLTYLKNGYPTLAFTLPDVYGKPVSLKDSKYKNKVVLVTITGTWCPNCIDEAAFLAPWYKKNKSRGVEIISLHYERKTDTAYARKVITRFRKRFGIEYDELFGGMADKQTVSETLPALNSFLSFPTTIFIDRQGNVNKIHTGFSGPATGKYYDAFIKEFTAKTDSLLN